MKNRLPILFLAALFTLITHSGFSQYAGKSDTDKRIEALTGRMTLDEKIELLSGTGVTGFDTRENTRLGIPAFRMTDGPLGVRWGKTTAFPSGVSLAATWDTAMAARFATALADEAHARGRNYLLGPCVNIHRLPTGGRNFESYGEDPYLTGRLAVSYIKALQSNHVISSIKHFALNNQEWRRTELDVRVEDRAMREIYLPAFEAAVKEGGVYTVMSAYNKVNGWWCSENQVLLNDILKKEWGFQGLVVSDWGSTHSTIDAANHGLDLEMPVGDVFALARLKKTVLEGKVTEATINDKVKRILWVKQKAGLFTTHFAEDTTMLVFDAHKKLAREIAEESMVLLKNSNNILPLNQANLKKIAIIGPNAMTARTGGGGSSHVSPYYSISPFDGIKSLVKNTAQVVYAPGDQLRTSPILAIATPYLERTEMAGKGLKAEFFKNMKLEGTPALVRVDSLIDFNWEDNPPAPGIDKDGFSVRWTGYLMPPVSRSYTLYTASDDGVRVYIDGKLVINNWTNHGTTIDSVKIILLAGKSYNIKVEYYEDGGDAVMILGWDLPEDGIRKQMVSDAVKVATGADVAIIFAGTSEMYESEGFDRTGGLKLPGNQDELIKAVAAANPHTIVVLNTGTPVITNGWLNNVQALVEAFFPGQEGGNAIADVLFGNHNPSGKLPFSFISGNEQSPAYAGYMSKSLDAPYTEGIFVGYRYLEKNKLTPTFPFGFGLSYTSFAYSPMKVVKAPKDEYLVTLKVKNSGKVAGSEIVQLYVADDHSKIARPVKELKGFSKVTLAPGQEKEVSIRLNFRSFAYYDETGKEWKVEPGTFTLMAGSSSADIRQKINLVIK
ncbi:MAG: glycoside hydrolase family 3 C-terminal domain-containing protein [Bacteroidota bacterium]